MFTFEFSYWSIIIGSLQSSSSHQSGTSLSALSKTIISLSNRLLFAYFTWFCALNLGLITKKNRRFCALTCSRETFEMGFLFLCFVSQRSNFTLKLANLRFVVGMLLYYFTHTDVRARRFCAFHFCVTTVQWQLLQIWARLGLQITIAVKQALWKNLQEVPSQPVSSRMQFQWKRSGNSFCSKSQEKMHRKDSKRQIWQRSWWNCQHVMHWWWSCTWYWTPNHPPRSWTFCLITAEALETHCKFAEAHSTSSFHQSGRAVFLNSPHLFVI